MTERQGESTDRLRVVIVNYRSAAQLRWLLENTGLSRHEVVVVDNASEPHDVLELAQLHGVKPVLLDRNVGFAAGINQALDQMPRSELPILLLNPDMRISDGVLVELRRRLDTMRLDGIAPLLLDEGEDPFSVGPGGFRPTLWTVTTHALLLTHLLPWTRGLFLTRGQAVRGRQPDWLCMACVLVKADVFERFGPIPEDELVYAEDMAWGSAAFERGARFALATDLPAVHEGGASGASHAWIGATERLIRRRVPGWRGRMAARIFRLGLLMRRMLGRQIT
jgi:N-acetylglucosaminyl-diphospho-decaprenol L-rhamnosyltransferase